MTTLSPPRIFSRSRRVAARRRMLALQGKPDAPRYLIEDMVEDVLERLAFLRIEPAHAMIVGDHSGTLAVSLRANGVLVDEAEPALGFDDEQPWAASGYDFIASLAALDTVNDLPGALVHMRNALAQGGLMIASFMGAGSIPALRKAMLEADGERPAPRLHPMVDVRAGAQLLQRTGYADPVADHRSLDVAYRSLDRLIGDLRAQALGNVLSDPGPPLRKSALGCAREAFAAQGENGRTVERFEILTLSGWKR